MVVGVVGVVKVVGVLRVVGVVGVVEVVGVNLRVVGVLKRFVTGVSPLSVIPEKYLTRQS